MIQSDDHCCCNQPQAVASQVMSPSLRRMMHLNSQVRIACGDRGWPPGHLGHQGHGSKFTRLDVTTAFISTVFISQQFFRRPVSWPDYFTFRTTHLFHSCSQDSSPPACCKLMQTVHSLHACILLQNPCCQSFDAQSPLQHDCAAEDHGMLL